MKKTLCILMALSLLIAFVACQPAQPTQVEQPSPAEPVADPAPAASEKGIYTPGTYEGEAQGNNGSIVVSVTFDEVSITSVKIVEQQETVGIAEPALERIPQQVVANQTLNVDTISGATNTSVAVLKAIEACVISAGGDPLSLQTPIEKAGATNVTYKQADIVIVGGGLSGICAAAAATEKGASVIVMEKLASTGGSAKASLGSFMIAEVDENEPYHITDEDDTLDAAIKRWTERQAASLVESKYPDTDRLKAQLIQTMFTVDWLKTYGVTFEPKTPIAERGMAMLQADVPGKEGLQMAKVMTVLRESVESRGGEVLLETPATELIMENGNVVGVKGMSPDGPVEIKAKSVILATGGFARDPEMMQKYIPAMKSMLPITSVGTTGDGQRMALEAGAVELADAWVIPSWPGPTNEFYAVNPHATVFQYANSPLDISEDTYHRLMVDKDGTRFMNEAKHYSFQVIEMVDRNAFPYWSVYDNLNETVTAIAESGLATGTVVKGNTIEELAAAAGIDPSVLKKTVDRYNEMCAKGDTDFGKAEEFLNNPVAASGPYYMVQVIPAASDTLGGVETNENRQVLRADGSVINGLYAVGAMSNKYYYNQVYFSGASLTFSSSDGYIAGTHAAS